MEMNVEGRNAIMTSVKIMLTTISDVQSFVNTMIKCPFDVDLVSGRYIIDAKSIMGIFSLDWSKPIQAEIHADPEECKNFIESLKPFLAE